MEINKEYYRNRYKEKRKQILNNQRIWRKRNPEKAKKRNQNYYFKKKSKFDSLNNEI